MKPAIQKSLTQLQISVQGTNRRYCLSQKDVSLQDGKLRTNTLLNQPIQGLAEGMKAAYLTRPELIEGMVYLNLGNFDDWKALKPRLRFGQITNHPGLASLTVWLKPSQTMGRSTEYRCSWKTLTNENEPSLPFQSTKFSWLHHNERNLHDVPRP